jgi:hypothetical protein
VYKLKLLTVTFSKGVSEELNGKNKKVYKSLDFILTLLPKDDIIINN